MPSALDQFRIQNQGLQPELDPYGARGLTSRHTSFPSPAPIGNTSPVPVVQQNPTPVPKPVRPLPATPVPKPTVPATGGPIMPTGQGIVKPTDRVNITTNVTPPQGAVPVPKPTGRQPFGGTGTSGPTGPGTYQPTPGTGPTSPGGEAGIIQGGPPASFSPYNVVTDNINNLLSSNSRYIQNARQRGMEAAAGRGLINSSIAAGTAERAAIESSMPILNQIMGLTSQRESQAFQQQFAQTQATLQDWANNRQFEREFNAQLSLIPIASSADMWSSLINLAANDPTVFTPTVLAGYQDFFQNGFNEYVGRYLEGIDFTGGGG